MAAEMLRVLIVMAFLLAASSAAGNFSQLVNITWGNGLALFLDEFDPQVLSLSLDNSTGSGCESTTSYLFARFDMQMKLVPGNSAGTVTTFFLSSQGAAHDEIDMEFLGNSSGLPYTLHTNIYVAGVGNREQQFRLWFDPTKAFHTYTILWNSQRIIYLVDNIAIRVFNNNSAYGIPFPTTQPMKMYASLWNADDWATQGGRVKTNWTLAPFSVGYRNLNINGCAVSGSWNSCSGNASSQAWQTQALDANGRNQIRWAQQYYMIYNYCNDTKRFPQGLPKECKLPRF